jgi:hypothetical protein
VKDFERNPNIEYAPEIYFYEPKNAAKWAYELRYNYICDVEIPTNATVLHFSDKSRTDKILEAENNLA